MNIKNENELKYLLNYMDYVIENYVFDVLNDNKEKPEYSAVTCVNLIKCYDKVMSELDEKYCHKDLKSYLSEIRLTDEEIETFLDSYNKESEYYIGKIF